MIKYLGLNKYHSRLGLEFQALLNIITTLQFSNRINRIYFISNKRFIWLFL